MKVIDRAGSRQISITPKDGDEPVAYYVSGDALAPDVGCVAGYVQADGTLGESAVFKTPEEWGTIKVSDPGIIPDSKYAVQSAVGTMDDPQLGEPVDVTTWKWGGVANSVGEPVGDGLIDVNDVLCAMEGFGAPAECAALDQQPCSQIDGSMNLDDLLVVTEAFGGETFATTCAATYPPCPGPTNPPKIKKNPYYFTGQRLDLDLKVGFNSPTLALYHYRARAYDPIHGRFLQSDPIQYSDSLNPLEYVRSQPTALVDPLGLTSRGDVSSGRLAYSCNCGWIDWGHANPAGPRDLWQQINTEIGIDSRTRDGFRVWYVQTMGPGDFIGAGGPFFVPHHLSLAEKESAALGIFQNVSVRFETLQSNCFWGHLTSSGFAEEDLPSNLISFYRAVKGYSIQQIKVWCNVLNQPQSLMVWDNGGSPTGTNTTWKPVYHKTPCCPPTNKWPMQLDSISASNNWHVWSLELDAPLFPYP